MDVATAICVQALTANIFSRLFTFETARLKFQTARFPWKREWYSVQIINNYLPKSRWFSVNIYQDAKRRGKYSPRLR